MVVGWVEERLSISVQRDDDAGTETSCAFEGFLSPGREILIGCGPYLAVSQAY